MDLELAMFAESFYIPKIRPGTPRGGGDDANFICNEKQVIGVADGIGSWWKKGIDPGKYACLLMKNAEEYVKNPQIVAGATNPKSILTDAFHRTTVPGSSTACILSFEGNLLRAANVGDSGFMVIREGTTLLRSPVQQKRFNCPYQLGTEADRPEDADEIALVLKSGDVVVVGTDGLFDNLFPKDVEEMVGLCLSGNMRPGIMACKLAMKALWSSVNRTRVSPFELAAREAGLARPGGKYDDITVVAAYVSNCRTRLEFEHVLEDGKTLNLTRYIG